MKDQLIRHIRADWQRLCGRQYRIKLEALDVADLRELMRLNRDIEHERQVAANRARMMPWRRV